MVGEGVYRMDEHGQGQAALPGALPAARAFGLGVLRSQTA